MAEAEDEPFDWPADWQKALPAIERRVRGLCLHFRLSEADAEEVDADLKAEFWRQTQHFADTGRPFFRTVPAAAAWAGMVAKRKILKMLRLQRRAPRTLSGGQDLATVPAADPGDAELLELINALPDPEEREACRLKFFEKCTLEEIGERLGVSTTTAYNRFWAGYRKLGRRLNDGDQNP